MRQRPIGRARRRSWSSLGAAKVEHLDRPRLPPRHRHPADQGRRPRPPRPSTIGDDPSRASSSARCILVGPFLAERPDRPPRRRHHQRPSYVAHDRRACSTELGADVRTRRATCELSAVHPPRPHPGPPPPSSSPSSPTPPGATYFWAAGALLTRSRGAASPGSPTESSFQGDAGFVRAPRPHGLHHRGHRRPTTPSAAEAPRPTQAPSSPTSADMPDAAMSLAACRSVRGPAQACSAACARCASRRPTASPPSDIELAKLGVDRRGECPGRPRRHDHHTPRRRHRLGGQLPPRRTSTPTTTTAWP
jgi:hypothetical protein